MPLSFQDKIRPVATSTKPLSFQDKIRPVENTSVMPTAVPKPVQPSGTMFENNQNRAVGVAQSLLGTAVGTARGLQNVGLGIMGAFGADKNKYGLKSLKTGTQEGQAVTAALTPQNTQQQQGKLAGDIAQFIAPTSAINKATAGLSIVPRVIARTAPDVATTVAQNLGADIGQTGVNAGITGLTSGVANALIPAKPVRALSTIARTVAPGYVADVATGLAGQRGEDRTGGNAFIPGAGTALSAITAIPQVKQGTQKYLKDRPINKNYKALDTLQKSNKPLDRKIVMADKSGIDTKRILAESNLLAGAVDNNGTVNSKVAVSNLNEVLQPWEAKVGDALAVENKRIPLSDVQTKLLSTIDDSGLVGSMKQQAQARAMGELQALAMEADEAGTIPLKLVHDLKVQTNRNNAKSFIDPEKNAIGKIVGRGLKEFVETSTDAMDVKTYNQELRKFYALRTVLEALDGKKVEGGRLGKYFAQTVGAVAGNAVGGPVGALAGAEIGGKLKGAMMARTFAGSERGIQMQPTKKMLDALGNGQNQVPLNMLTATNTRKITPTPIPRVADGSFESNTTIASRPITASTKQTANVQIIPPIANRIGSPSLEKKVPNTISVQNQPIKPNSSQIMPLVIPPKQPLASAIPTAPKNTAHHGQMFAGGAAGFGNDDQGNITFDIDKAMIGMAAMAGAQKLPKAELLKRLRTSLPNRTKSEMADFVATIKSGAVKTGNDGYLQFATKADEQAFDAGLAIVNGRPMLRKFANDTLAKIANLYDEVLTTR